MLWETWHLLTRESAAPASSRQWSQWQVLDAHRVSLPTTAQRVSRSVSVRSHGGAVLQQQLLVQHLE
eukprot:12168699-Alexandrium_andersonii.AAC.1